MKEKRKITDHSEEIKGQVYCKIRCKNNCGEIAFKNKIWNVSAKNGEDFIFVKMSIHNRPMFKSTSTGVIVTGVEQMTIKAYIKS